MSNWTEEYLWDRQEAEQQSQKAMKNTTLGKFITALYIYTIMKKLNKIFKKEMLND